MGFTKRWTVAVWVGYPDKLKPMLTEFAGAPVEGGTYPALIWHDFMVAANAIADDRNAKDRERKGLPPKPPADQTTTTTTRRPVIPTKPAPVPEGGAGAPPAPQTADRAADDGHRHHGRRHRDRDEHGHDDHSRRPRPPRRRPAAAPAPAARAPAAAPARRTPPLTAVRRRCARARAAATAATRGGCRARRSASRGRRPS